MVYFQGFVYLGLWSNSSLSETTHALFFFSLGLQVSFFLLILLIYLSSHMPFQFGFSFFYSLMLCLLAHFYDFPDSTSISMMLSVNFSVFFFPLPGRSVWFLGKLREWEKNCPQKDVFIFIYFFYGVLFGSRGVRGKEGEKCWN